MKRIPTGSQTVGPFFHFGLTACTLALAADGRTPGLLANFLHSMVQEHECAAGRKRVEEAILATGAPPDIPDLTKPEDYLGSAELFRRRLLGEER